MPGESCHSRAIKCNCFTMAPETLVVGRLYCMMAIASRCQAQLHVQIVIGCLYRHIWGLAGGAGSTCGEEASRLLTRRCCSSTSRHRTSSRSIMSELPWLFACMHFLSQLAGVIRLEGIEGRVYQSTNLTARLRAKLYACSDCTLICGQSQSQVLSSTCEAQR